jgi:hypothetical protein
VYKKVYPKLSRPRVERKDYTKLFRLMEVERKDRHQIIYSTKVETVDYRRIAENDLLLNYA